MKTDNQSLLADWLVIIKDPWILSLATWVPIALYIMLNALFSGGITHDLPLGVVDHDKSSLSRKFIQYYDAPAALTTKVYASENEAFSALRTGNIYGLVIIPHNLYKDTRKGLGPQITALVNYQYLLIGKQINSNLRKAHAQLAAGIAVTQELARPENTVELALAAASPFAIQTTALANISSNYAQFLVTAMIPAAWQIFAVMLAVLSLSRLHRAGRLQPLIQGRAFTPILNRLAPIFIFLILQSLFFYWMMFYFFDWPMTGSWILLMLALLLATVACLNAGSLFYLASADPARALSLTAAYTAPGFAFMGITFPATNMNIWAEAWRSILPLTHLSEIQVAEANYGVPVGQLLPSFAALILLILIMGSLCSLTVRKKGKTLQQGEAL